MSRRIKAALAAVISVSAYGAAGGAATPAVAHVAGLAVVSLAAPAPATALRSPGIRVVATFPYVGAAAVRGTPAALAQLARRPGVRSVVPDRVLRPAGASAPSSGGVFASTNLGGRAGKPGAGAGVTVALVDTGISDSPALNRSSGRLVDAVDTSGEARYTDGYGHGTFLAGLIAGGPVAQSDGVAVGVAPGARVLNVKVADRSGTTSLVKVLAGLDWVTAHAAQVDVASFAFSHPRPGPEYGADPLTDAVERVRDAGVTVVVSAGNTPGVVGDPGFDPRVLTVGAADLTTKKAAVADFSGSALVAGVEKPDVVASGVRLLSFLPAASVIAAGFPEAQRGDGLWRGSGTSQATAVTAGVAALFLADHPDATPRQVKASLRAAAKPVPGKDGAGLVRVAHAVRDGADGPGAGDGGGDGESGFDANSWSANSWSANSWSANSWSANSWSANSWSANSWSAAPRGDGAG